MMSKFDTVTARKWKTGKFGEHVPSLDDMKAVLRKKAGMLDTLKLAKINVNAKSTRDK